MTKFQFDYFTKTVFGKSKFCGENTTILHYFYEKEEKRGKIKCFIDKRK